MNICATAVKGKKITEILKIVCIFAIAVSIYCQSKLPFLSTCMFFHLSAKLIPYMPVAYPAGELGEQRSPPVFRITHPGYDQLHTL